MPSVLTAYSSDLFHEKQAQIKCKHWSIASDTTNLLINV